MFAPLHCYVFIYVGSPTYIYLYVKKMPMALTFASLNLTNGPSSFQQPFEIESRGSDPPPPPPPASCDIEAQPSYENFTSHRQS